MSLIMSGAPKRINDRRRNPPKRRNEIILNKHIIIFLF